MKVAKRFSSRIRRIGKNRVSPIGGSEPAKPLPRKTDSLFDLESQLEVAERNAQWNMSGIAEPREVCNHSPATEYCSLSQDVKLTIGGPYVRWITEDDVVSEESLSFCDTLTEVTSLDSMSIDSELLSILGGGEAQLRESIELTELELMFTPGEEEKGLPDYVLFMSLPPQ